MRVAQASGIDAFALDVGTGALDLSRRSDASDANMSPQLANAYAAAKQTGFANLISFDFSAQPAFATNWCAPLSIGPR